MSEQNWLHLPSGRLLNLDHIILVTPHGDGRLMLSLDLATSSDDIEPVHRMRVAGDDGHALLDYLIRHAAVALAPSERTP